MSENSDKKAVFGWVMYDWANSAFATTVMAGFFPVFFKAYWNAGVEVNVSTFRLGVANSVASLIIVLSAPVLGAIADKAVARKKFLLLFAGLGILASCSLFFVAKGFWVAAATAYVLASLGFSGANVFYDATLTLVSSEKRMDAISALGYAMGYLGGGLLFAVNVWMTLDPAKFGLAGPSIAVRVAFLMVGVWWAIFTIPLMAYVKESITRPMAIRGNPVRDGFSQLAKTFRDVRRYRMVFLFLFAYWFYIDGVDTIIRMAVDYGLSIGLESKDLILALLLTQFVGFPCAILFGWLGGKIGAKRGIYAAIGAYLLISIFGAFVRDAAGFYALAIAVGFVQGGIQSLSRSYFAKLIPKDKAAEFFGFYNMLGKFAAVIGPLLMGGVGLALRSALNVDSGVASRFSISSISILFVIGAILLSKVDATASMAKAK